jgi:DNA-binding MarR family transcriptional regulator
MSTDEVTERASALRRGVTRLGRRLRLERPEQGAPLLQLATLALLNGRGPMTPGELAAAQQVQPQSLTRTLTALETAGLASRRTDPGDRRRSLLMITDAGRHVIQHDVSQRNAWLAMAMAELLTPAEQELLRIAGQLMERLAEANATDLHAPMTG